MEPIKKLIILGFLLFATNVYASDINSIFSTIKGDSRKVTNGRYWNSLNNESKASYLVAFGEGEFTYSIMLNSNVYNKMSKEDKTELDKTVLDKLNMKKDTGEILDYLNKFYSEPLNLDIPIHFAITSLSLQPTGSNLNEMIQMLRRNSEPTND